MIKYNLNSINDWNFGEDNIIKVYRNDAVCYYKISGTPPGPTAQTPCFAVVDDITQYSDTEFEDVFNLADDKWYKLNNLNQYEEYGVYGSGRTITTYEGKLTIDGDYEYIYSGGSWVNVGEISGGTIQTVWFDPPSSGDNAKFNIGHYWGENYKMIWTMYLQGSYSNDTGSFWQTDNKSPIELHFYSNGYYYDMHNPTSTSSPSVYTGDYSYRIMRQRVFNNYENSQVMDVTLTYGSVKVELVDSGTVIENTGSTRTGFSWYNGLYEPSIFLQSSQKCHLSRIQVYNASNVLVNDITFVKNNGVTGSQEISMYDSVLNVTYNNTNSNTPTYHIVEEGGGGYEYPLEYVVREDPPDNLVFTSMEEAEEYECPWVGMKATIDGSGYTFSGDSISGYEWVYTPKTLPTGYTAVEYIQNASTAYINTNYYPNQDTRIVAEMQVVSFNTFGRLLGAGNYNTANTISCDYIDSGSTFEVSWGGYTGWTQYSVTSNYDKHIYDWNKNSFYIDGTLLDTKTFKSFTCSYKLGIFNVLESGDVPTSNTGRYFYGKLYSFKIYDNDTLVRDFVPCKRDSDSKYGLYDVVNDVFYISPNNTNFSGGSPV